MTVAVKPAAVWAFDGQSLAILPGPVQAYPAKVLAAYPGDVGPTVARGSSTWTQRAEDAARRVDRHLRRVTGPGRLVDLGAQSELLAGQASGTILTAAEAYWTARAAAGWAVWACTIPDGDYTSPQQTQRAALNQAIRSSAVPTGVVDLDATLLGDWTGNPSLFLDTLHLSGTGATLAADTIVAEVTV